jgi:hypothetical protein
MSFSEAEKLGAKGAVFGNILNKDFRGENYGLPFLAESVPNFVLVKMLPPRPRPITDPTVVRHRRFDLFFFPKGANSRIVLMFCPDKFSKRASIHGI